MSVRFCDACQGGGAYGKTALARPYAFFVKYLPGIPQEISDPSVSPSRSPQPNDRAERVSERVSGIYSVSHFLLTRFLSLSAPVLCGINAMCYCHATS
ncbi:hypothetical protein CBM57_004957 [Salmonella enterica subsp. enterica]|uniref:Uncharacterized protein n=1 Tax=Salmonella typhimurium TaxID=90371 RepID=A0A634B013_SALTM|nr:hypothetical protein [Salmonella enterica subsp. enterica serovar Typhimurium]EDF0850739.1 hypothetical protein [Salmonella enterica subsp. enterica serovar Enteritidis]EDP9285372.1 hypothetical protein [Salmonella enterica subsp. enterica]EDA2407859.1 hypothetical protein [Salmonella enterica subsp. enterica serovar Typhimurium]EDA6960835.1 hypothetical protein [Salmonella enterica subsp. enterica serovar Typhimurium]